MILKKNKYATYFVALIILASCSTTSNNLKLNSIALFEETSQKEFLEIFDYQSYSLNDLEKIQKAINSDILDLDQLRDAKLLKNNYQKIISKKKYTLELKPNQKNSKEIIELIYKSNLPVSIFWDEKKQISLPKNLLSQQINGFCSSLYDDAIESINEAMNESADSILVIYSQEYASFVEGLKLGNSNLITMKHGSSSFQEFSAEILGVKLSESRFKKIASLNPNQNLNFIPRPRSDLKQIVILLKPQDYKAMIPALRYHGGSRFQYLNFISSLEDINTPLQLLDYEDSWAPISNYITTKIQKDSSASLERFLELGVLNDWLIVHLLKQAGVQSAKINGITGSIFYKSNSCVKRKIPLQKISSDLFSS